MVCGLPRIIWIELTSKCPFDCIFCSRATLRGNGEHMEMDLYRSILSQLEEPEIIRLNYSGESIHHPHLIEAIELAAALPGTTELVSAFASIPRSKIDGVAAAGLDRLTISIHTLDPGEYQRIYRYSSVEELKRSIEALLSARGKMSSPRPRLDFAFVAMRRNLKQLARVADYAASLGVTELFIHPVIRRDEIPFRFEEELEEGRLRDSFKKDLREAVGQVRATHPQLSVSLSTTELDDDRVAGQAPRPYPQPLPAGARIRTCDQNPWETIHILANGDVVTCEVREKVVVGNLRRESLAAVWRGEAYESFRRRYERGDDAACRVCPYKLVYRPSRLRHVVSAKPGSRAQLLRGWHDGDDGGVVWSKKESAVMLGNPGGDLTVRVRGILPPPAGGEAMTLEVICDGSTLGIVTNRSREFRTFDERFRAHRVDGTTVHLEFRSSEVYCPASSGQGRDTRALGFALIEAEARRE